MRYFLGFLAAIGLIVLVFVLIIRGFTGHKSSNPTNQSSLMDYAGTSTVMQLTIDGPIVSDQNHRAVRITVGRDQTTFETIKGYDGQVDISKSYENTQASYANFLRAIQLLGYNRGDTDPAKSDERGYCPNGRRYIFEVVTGSASVQRFWRGSCGVGTFKGNNNTIVTLFKQQVPDYTQVTGNLQL
jgi:hypothetical protein